LLAKKNQLSFKLEKIEQERTLIFAFEMLKLKENGNIEVNLLKKTHRT